MLAAAAITLLAFRPAAAQYFERDGWPGAGVPVLSSRADSLELHLDPTTKAPKKSLRFRTGWRIVFDRSKVITKRSIVLTALRRIDGVSCDGATVSILPGDNIEYLQYRGEGYGKARVGTRICDVMVEEEGTFQRREEDPVTEWWIRVVGADGRPQGWLLVEEARVEVRPPRR